ncbi:hypothetical protein BLI708_00220 [Bifidobacterium imperatoris]|uniref:Uncharacterized protein n=1 Tax=Bifidobacterium imperatoris TaxID=2020965 RepID=A0A2N5IPW3_9BIFI|nr:hypothetical protein [Bifidobacterium imperatoris]PLS23976.1 hypothetical protein Tam1G_1960 [Bifidobacterium imperatoris]QSY57765.1 hypothetical protein BLI708_11375 [Bifidobacterium imperatoris]QSY57807.1 hypothetical protein BLI708_00220 [Bifidobacterium imperatoris]
MTGQKNIRAEVRDLYIRQGMPVEELIDQLQRSAELQRAEAECFDEETREPCDCPVCHEDKDTIVKESRPAPFDKWQHYTDMLADLHDIILQLAADAYEYGDLNLERRSIETLNSVVNLTEQFANMRRKAEKQ